VAAAIFDKSKAQLVYPTLHRCDKPLPCEHAEQLVINSALHDRINLQECAFFTTLEPCSHRGSGHLPCAHRIATLSFPEIHIGMMDPNPDIFGHGVSYVLNNLPEAKIHYAPKHIRHQLIQINEDWVKKQADSSTFHAFKRRFPLVTTDDDEMYLRFAHACFRVQEMTHVVWLFPRLPSFADIHKFHAVWAEGMLENPHIDVIYLIMHERDWAKGIREARKMGKLEQLQDEFTKRGTEAKPEILVLLQKGCPPDCGCREFHGALLWNENNCVRDLRCLVVPSYTEVADRVISAFMVCDPSYIATKSLCDSRRPRKVNGRRVHHQCIDRREAVTQFVNDMMALTDDYREHQSKHFKKMTEVLALEIDEAGHE
jgi:pyrimidine deaminase RibD-like protein